jgi:hypothetical protein
MQGAKRNAVLSSKPRIRAAKLGRTTDRIHKSTLK